MDLLAGFPRAETDVHVVRHGFPPLGAINKKMEKKFLQPHHLDALAEMLVAEKSLPHLECRSRDRTEASTFHQVNRIAS